MSADPVAAGHERSVSGADTELVSASGLFEPAFYRKQLRRRRLAFDGPAAGGTIVAASPDPVGGAFGSSHALLDHFLACGASAGLSPHPLFDASAYLLNYPDVAAAGMNPLIHYLRYGGREGRRPSPLFNPAFYRRDNPDLALDLNPLVHFVQYGAGEGRRGWTPEDAERLVSEALADAGGSAYLADRPRSVADDSLVTAEPARIGVYARRDAAPATHELRELLAAELCRCGVIPVPLEEGSDPSEGLDLRIVVSPHTFFGLNAGPCVPQTFPIERTVLLNTESPQSPVFARCLPLFCRAAAVLDSDPAAVALLQRLGIDTFFLPLAPADQSANDAPVEDLPDSPFTRALPKAVRQFRAGADDPLSARPLDVLFVGAATERRCHFFARSAAAFSRFSCVLHLPDVAPWGGADESLLDSVTEAGLARRAKVVLNVHAAAGPGFEWQRIVLHGMAQGALVVSEPCTPLPGLRAGEQFLEAPLHEIPDLVHWLLTTQAGAAMVEQIRCHAAAALRERFDPCGWLDGLLPALRELAAQ